MRSRVGEGRDDGVRREGGAHWEELLEGHCDGGREQ